MTPLGLKAVEHAFDKEKDKKEKFVNSFRNINELKKNKLAWKNFQKFPEHYKRIRIAYIGHHGERSEEEFRKKLDYFIKMTEKNKRFGMMR